MSPARVLSRLPSRMGRNPLTRVAGAALIMWRRSRSLLNLGDRFVTEGRSPFVPEAFAEAFGDVPYLSPSVLLHHSTMEKTDDTFLGKRGRSLFEPQGRTLYVLPGREM